MATSEGKRAQFNRRLGRSLIRWFDVERARRGLSSRDLFKALRKAYQDQVRSRNTGGTPMLPGRGGPDSNRQSSNLNRKESKRVSRESAIREASGL